MTEALVAAIRPGSKADRIKLEPGDRILKVNGETIKDLIELSFALSEKKVTLDVVKASGEKVQLRLSKAIDEDLGIEFESAVFDRVRTCANKCLFCFVDQMPLGLRDSLYVKDDDYRLSFLYGNFVTLTNLTTADFDRIRRFHLSPLYVSVHTTDGALRTKMLGVPRAADIMAQLRKLTAAGIELHTQIVLCPGWNDQAALRRTVHELAELQPEILSVAVVPVGLTRFRESCAPLRTFTVAEASELVAEATVWQKTFRAATGRSFVYLSDEFYLRAGRALPPETEYDGYPQIENGIGLVRSFISEWDSVRPAGVARPATIDTVLVSGTAFAPILAQLTAPWGDAVRVAALENNFFGGGVNVSGLLVGQDIAAQLARLARPPQRIILPTTLLRRPEEIFLDGMTLTALRQQLGLPVQVATGAQHLYALLSEGGECL